MNTLTASQREAIESDHNNILVLAGPGSGKTQVTVERIRRLIEQGVNPARIVAITWDEILWPVTPVRHVSQNKPSDPGP